jgi:hypothetical protein
MKFSRELAKGHWPMIFGALLVSCVPYLLALLSELAGLSATSGTSFAIQIIASTFAAVLFVAASIAMYDSLVASKHPSQL